jgi:hypothetical protein
MILIVVIGILIPALIGDGISELPPEKQPYGEAAIRGAFSLLDNPSQKFFNRKLKVKSVEINEHTGELQAIVHGYTFFGLPNSRIELSGKDNPQDSDMGFTTIWFK